MQQSRIQDGVSHYVHNVGEAPRAFTDTCIFTVILFLRSPCAFAGELQAQAAPPTGEHTGICAEPALTEDPRHL